MAFRLTPSDFDINIGAMNILMEYHIRKNSMPLLEFVYDFSFLIGPLSDIFLFFIVLPKEPILAR